ncbi:MAG: hypothetical protein Salg2KO_05800 [Salibacteraceae bacterium]
MGKLRLLNKLIRALWSEPSRIYQVLQKPMEDGRYSAAYVSNTYGLTSLPSVNILDLVNGLDEQLNYYSYLPGTSLVVDIALLRALCRERSNCAYLEIGTWRGESIANMIDVTDERYAVTLSADDLKSRGLTDTDLKFHGFYIEPDMEVHEIFADSSKFDFGSLGKKFDVIFIDGDHSKQGVENDSRKVFPLLKNDDSVIVWHDYGWDTERVRYNTLAGILDGSPTWSHSNIYHVIGTKCAIFTKKDLPTYQTKRHDLPSVNFEHRIVAKAVK